MATNVDAAFSQISAQLSDIQTKQAASKSAQDKLILDIEKFLAQNTGGLTASQQAVLAGILDQAKAVSDGLVTEAAEAVAEDVKANPETPAPTV